MTGSLKASWWPLIVAIALFLGACGACWMLSKQVTGGRLIYALDDPYIHMAMAKNVASHGVWGVTASHFTSSSSSLLWTAALAGAFAVVGIREFIPFALNVTFGIALLAVVFRFMSETGEPRRPLLVLAVLAAIVFAAPLPALTFAGLEHILHALLTVVFVAHSAWWLAADDRSVWDRAFVTLVLVAVLLPLVRFEGLFAVAIVSALAALRRRWLHAGLLALGGALPVLAYGAISASQGWYWLPTTVLLKGSRPDLSTATGIIHALGYVAYSRIQAIPAVGFLVYGALAAFAYRLRRETFDATQWMLVLFVLLSVSHMQYAQPRAFWLYRYEAYLVVLGIFVFAQVTREWLSVDRMQWARSRRLVFAGAILLGMVLSPLVERSVRSLMIVPTATRNIYEQQYQMGLFLRHFYNGSAVALNDIGAPCFLADIQASDLVGLADLEVARRRLRGWFMHDDVQELVEARGVRIAIVYEEWFRGLIPRQWRRAGTWSISNNVVSGGTTVSFYAVRADEYTRLRANLADFSRQLPPTVRWEQ